MHVLGRVLHPPSKCDLTLSVDLKFQIAHGTGLTSKNASFAINVIEDCA